MTWLGYVNENVFDICVMFGTTIMAGIHEENGAKEWRYHSASVSLGSHILI